MKDAPVRAMPAAVGRVPAGRVLIRPVSQSALRLRPSGQRDQEDLFRKTTTTILRWAQQRAGRPLPEASWEGHSFETSDIGAQRVAAVAIDEPKLWALRVDDADKAVAMRTWITEACVGIDPAGDVLVGVRQTCAMRGDIVEFDRTAPSFMRSIVALGGAELDGRPVSAAPWLVRTEPDVHALVDLLESRERSHAVVVISTDRGSDDPESAPISIRQLLNRVVGVAHVAVLTPACTEHLRDAIGHDMSLPWHAVRVYRPGFHRVFDQRLRHPLYTSERIADWYNRTGLDFNVWLATRAIEDSTSGGARRDELVPGFNAVRSAAAQLAREKSRTSGAGSDELLRLYEEDNSHLRQELRSKQDEFESLLEQSEREREDAEAEARLERSHVAVLQQRLDELQQQLSSTGAREQTPIPNSLDHFETWCHVHLGSSVVMHSRAFNSVKKSVYREPALLYKALLLLRDQYVPMRRQGGRNLVADFEAQCRKLDLENARVGEATKRFQDEYTVRWNGEPHVLEWHLKSGDTKDRSSCFRLYYSWDDDTGTVLVGSLPAHLRSEQT